MGGNTHHNSLFANSFFAKEAWQMLKSVKKMAFDKRLFYPVWWV